MDVQSVNILREICNVNGITYTDSETDVHTNKVLHVFFSGLPYCVQFRNFPYLSELVIISQQLTKIANIDACSNLRKLWICECQIEKIENLEGCKHIQELYLYGNRISCIKNLDLLQQLRKLLLNDNCIVEIEGISKLVKLSLLNLSGNSISKIGNGVDFNVNLSEIYLSGNKLHCLRDLLRLRKLKKLKLLSINEAGYVKNPLSLNPNLPIIILHNFPQLTRLDNTNVDLPYLRAAVNSVMKTKRSFYMLQLQHHVSRFYQKERKLCERYISVRDKTMSQVKMLDKALNCVQSRNSTKVAVHIDAKPIDVDTNTRLMKEIRSRLHFWHSRYDDLKKAFEQLKNEIHIQHELRVQLCQMELEFCGFIRVAEGSTTDDWFHKCSDMIASRFCGHVFVNVSKFTGIEVRRIFRITNKMTHYNDQGTWERECTDSQIENTDNSVGDGISSQNKTTYLFLLRNGSSGEVQAYLNILKYGFQKATEGIQLTNYVNSADSANILNVVQRKCELSDTYFEPLVHFLIVKVSDKNGRINDLNQNIECKKNCTTTVYHTANDLQSSGIDHTCRCISESNIQTYFDSSVLVPEFIAEIKYVFQPEPLSACTILMNEQIDTTVSFWASELNKDMELVESIPSWMLQPLSLKESQSEFTANKDISDISLVDIQNPQEFKFEKFKNLTTLRMNHCNLQILPTLSGLNLRLLDVSHNKLTSMESLSKLSSVENLSIAYNLLTNIYEELHSVHSACPCLRSLHLQGNPWLACDTVRCLAAAICAQVQTIDDIAVNHADKMEGLNILSVMSLEQDSIEQCCTSYKFVDDYCVLSVYPIARYLLTLKTADHPRLHKLRWNNITSLCLQNCHLHRLEKMEFLVNLKYASFDNNHLTKLDGIMHCTNLEELSAENNVLTTINDVAYLKNLRRLLLGSNKLKSICGIQLGTLPNLNVLVLSCNRLQKLNGIELAKKLEELYVEGNFISDFKNILRLKPNSKLTVLDFSENPISKKVESYRSRVIHYLKGLKYLDGKEIQISEIIQAKELLGGRLSHEFLIERVGCDNFNGLTQLDLPNISLKVIDYLPPKTFTHLVSVNLEKNQLTSFGGLLLLPQLQILCLNENNVTSLFPRSIFLASESSQSVISNPTEAKYLAMYQSNCTIFQQLKTLHLANNRIRSLKYFQFHRMPALRSLFLQHNELTIVTGLEDLHQLVELVLDNNRIKNIGDALLHNQNIQELHIEYNRLMDLYPLAKLNNLKRLYAGFNRLSDSLDIEKFALESKKLLEISLINTPISEKQLHRVILVYGVPHIQNIDGMQVTEEERENALAFYTEQQLQTILNSKYSDSAVQSDELLEKKAIYALDLALPGIRTQKASCLIPKTCDIHLSTPPELSKTKTSLTVIGIGNQLCKNSEIHENDIKHHRQYAQGVKTISIATSHHEKICSFQKNDGEKRTDCLHGVSVPCELALQRMLHRVLNKNVQQFNEHF